MFNGGIGVPSSQIKLYDTNLTLSSVIPARQNYSFYHWNTASDNNINVNDGQIMSIKLS